jgi:hypothetical protein
MDSSLHMHVASLKIQDEIRRGATARLAKQAEQASKADAKATGDVSGHWVALRRVFRPSFHHVSSR